MEDWSHEAGATPTFHARSRYVERFWLPILGPSPLWLLRRLVDGLETSPSGYLLPVETTARSLGLGSSAGRHSPFRRAVGRGAHFGVLRHDGAGRLAVRTRLAPLPAHLLARLPDPLRLEHGHWLTRPVDLEALRSQVRRLAVELSAVLDPPEAVEAQLQRAGFHPALAYEAVRWVAGLTSCCGAPPRRTVGGRAGRSA